MHPITGLIGGTFDPIHLGHWQMIQNLLESFPFQSIYLIPDNIPPHRPPPLANPLDRYQMLKLVVLADPRLKVHDIELKRPGFSYTIETVKFFAKRKDAGILCFILSMDAFLNFDQWQEYQKIVDYCHLIVVNRPHYVPLFNKELTDFVKKRQVASFEILQQFNAGKILFHQINALPISATSIRQMIAEGKDPSQFLLPSTWQYIQTHQLYQASVP